MIEICEQYLDYQCGSCFVYMMGIMMTHLEYANSQWMADYKCCIIGTMDRNNTGYIIERFKIYTKYYIFMQNQKYNQ